MSTSTVQRFPSTTLFRSVDFIAVSFCHNAADMDEARAVARKHGSHAALVSKIERAEAIENLSEIVEASDVVMVARGDLGAEIGDAELPGLQKKIRSEEHTSELQSLMRNTSALFRLK